MTPLRELERKYRRLAGDHELNALEADSIGLNESAKSSDKIAKFYEDVADDLAALLATASEQTPVADSELPGMWSASDFTGGDPDERCHAERAQVACRGYAKLGVGAYLIEHSAESEPAALMLCVASDEEKAGRTVGDLKTFEGERQPIPAEKMTIRIDFANVAGLDALEQQLRLLREVHFPTSPAHTSEARDAARYRWLRNRAINFGLDDESGTPYCVYGIGCGDANPTDGEELDNMIDHCAEIDVAKEQAP